MAWIWSIYGLYMEHLTIGRQLSCNSARKSAESQVDIMWMENGKIVGITWIDSRKLPEGNPEELKLGVK